MGRQHAGTVKILLSAVPHWERGLGLECKNSTINLMFRAVAPTPMSGTSNWWGKNGVSQYNLCFLCPNQSQDFSVVRIVDF